MSKRGSASSLQFTDRRAAAEHEVSTPEGERRWLEWTDPAITDQYGEVVEIEYPSVGTSPSRNKLR